MPVLNAINRAFNSYYEPLRLRLIFWLIPWECTEGTRRDDLKPDSERKWPPRSTCIFMEQVQTHTAARDLAHIPELTGADTWPQQGAASSQPGKLSQACPLPRGYCSNPHTQGPCNLSVEYLHSGAGVGEKLLGSCHASVGMAATSWPPPRCKSMTPILPYPHPGPLWRAGYK